MVVWLEIDSRIVTAERQPQRSLQIDEANHGGAKEREKNREATQYTSADRIALPTPRKS